MSGFVETLLLLALLMFVFCGVTSAARIKRKKRTPKRYGRRLKDLHGEKNRFKGMLLNRQFRAAAYNVWQYFTRECRNGAPLRNVSQIM